MEYVEAEARSKALLDRFKIVEKKKIELDKEMSAILIQVRSLKGEINEKIEENENNLDSN